MYAANKDLRTGLISSKKEKNQFEGFLQLRKNSGTDTIEICDDNGPEYINLDASESHIRNFLSSLSLLQTF